MIVVGAALQGIGLSFVFYEVVSIRVHEFGVPVWWTRMIRWLRATFRRRRDIHAQVDLSGRLTFGGSLTAEKLRPTPLSDDASDAERFAWLERYVTLLDEDLARLPETIRREVGTATAKAQDSDRAIEEAIDAREQRRRHALKSSLLRQALGSAFVAAGLIIGTIGAVN
jgi:hypothetical protein